MDLLLTERLIKARIVYQKYTYGVHKKIFFPFSILSMVLLVSLTFVTSAVTMRYMRENMTENAKKLANQFNNNLNSAVSVMELALINLSIGGDAYTYFDTYYPDIAARYRAQLNLLNSVNYLGSLYNYCDIDIYTINNGYTISSNPHHDTLNFNKFMDKMSCWYDDVIRTDNEICVAGSYVPPGNEDASHRIGVVRKISDSGGNLIGLIAYSLNDGYFEDLLNNEEYGGEGIAQPDEELTTAVDYIENRMHE